MVHNPSMLARALTPASVAIVGARDSSATSYGVVEALARVGFEGPMFAVNRSAAPAHGLATAASCARIGEPVDAAVLLVPAAAVHDVLEDVAEAGIRTAVILSSGWAEGDAGLAELRLWSRNRHGVSVGPGAVTVSLPRLPGRDR